MSAAASFGGPTARAAGYVGCELCGRAAPATAGQCPRCGARLAASGRRPLDVVWAWLIAGVVLYIPANAYPMLITTQFGNRAENTIVGGAFDLASHGAYFIAAIVFTASVLIPVAKFAAIAWLALRVRAARPIPAHRAHLMYEAVEFIGRWSMVDVFVVAILAALVRMGFLASVEPGAAAAFFALSVAFTMMAARAFDPRLIWDRTGDRDV